MGTKRYFAQAGIQIRIIPCVRFLDLVSRRFAPVLVLLASLSAIPVEAAFPGANGKIVFRSDRDGKDEIYVMDADGGGQTRLTDNPASTTTSPTWSPDGTRIAFTSDRGGKSDIYVMDADGGNPTRLTDDPAGDAQPAWSPDGTKIAFSSVRDGLSNEDIFVINPDGTGQRRFTNSPEQDSFARLVARRHPDRVHQPPRRQ